MVTEWLSVPDLAERVGVTVGRVRGLLRERQLVGLRRAEGVGVQVPAAFVADGQIVRGLPGTLTVLADSGFDDEEALRWLFTVDDSLPGSPIEALRGNRIAEVRRRAQALAL